MYQQNGQYAYQHAYPQQASYDASWAQYYASQAAASAPPATPAAPAAPAQNSAAPGSEPPVPGAETPITSGTAAELAPPLPPSNEAQYDAYQYSQNNAYDAWYQQYYNYYGQYPTQQAYGTAQNSWSTPPAAPAPVSAPRPPPPQPPAAPAPPTEQGIAAVSATAKAVTRVNAAPSKAEIQAQIAAAASAAAARVGRPFNTAAPVVPSKASVGVAAAAPSSATAKAMAAAKAVASKLANNKSGASGLQPAFIKVQAPAGASTSATGKAPQGGASNEHPPALRNFVMRFFARGKVTEAEKEALRKLISDAREKGELWTRDWDRTPLPTVSNNMSISSTVTLKAEPRLQAQAPVAAAEPHIKKWGPTLKTSTAATTQAALNPGYLPIRSPGSNKKAQGKKNKRMREPSPPSSSSDGSTVATIGSVDPREAERRRKRAGRFGDGMAMDHKGNKLTKRSKGGPAHVISQRYREVVMADEEPEELDWDQMIVKGTCKDLEKSYFRLTSAPDPSTVRPERVLRAAYQRLIGLLANGERNYFYALDQFKGQRQDLTVQHIKNDLTVLVYEGHARSALEYGDVAEFNQCQTQLDVLYRQGISGSRHEFLAYRLLYLAVHARQGQGPALLTTLKSLTREDIAVPEVAHALQVRTAVARYDYVRFFQLYRSAPNLGRCIMDIYVSTMRRRAADVLATAIRPGLPVPVISSMLGFQHLPVDGLSEGDMPMDSDRVLPGCVLPGSSCGKNVGEDDEEDAWENCLAWLTASNATVTGSDPGSCQLDCAASRHNIITPQDTTAVAHGDANLAIDDFLSRAL